MLSMKYQRHLAVQLTYPRHLFQPATCSHEAELNRENLGFFHSHDHYAFVYIRRFNSLIHCQFLLFFVSSLNCSRLVLITTASQMHQNQSSQIFFECAIRMLLHIPKLRANLQRGEVREVVQAMGKVQTTSSVRICVRPQLMYSRIYETSYFVIVRRSLKFSQWRRFSRDKKYQRCARFSSLATNKVYKTFLIQR